MILERLFTLSAHDRSLHIHLRLLLRELDHLYLVGKHLNALQVLKEQGQVLVHEDLGLVARAAIAFRNHSNQLSVVVASLDKKI